MIAEFEETKAGDKKKQDTPSDPFQKFEIEMEHLLGDEKLKEEYNCNISGHIELRTTRMVTVNLTDDFTTEEKKYMGGSYLKLPSRRIFELLKRLSEDEEDEEDERLEELSKDEEEKGNQGENNPTLTVEGKKALAIRLVKCIMKDESAFIKIFMNKVGSLGRIAYDKYLKGFREAAMQQAALIIEKNNKVRENLIQNISDIDDLTKLDSYYETIFLKALVKANDLDRLLKTNKQLCKEVRYHSNLAPFFIKSALVNKNLFEALFESDKDVDNLKKAMFDVKLDFPESLQEEIHSRIPRCNFCGRFTALVQREMEDTESEDEIVEEFKVFDRDGNGLISYRMISGAKISERVCADCEEQLIKCSYCVKKEKFKKCYGCESRCKECLEECINCKEIFCHGCVSRCERSDYLVCKFCLRDCEVCSKKYCEWYCEEKCEFCGITVCDSCIKQGQKTGTLACPGCTIFVREPVGRIRKTGP